MPYDNFEKMHLFQLKERLLANNTVNCNASKVDTLSQGGATSEERKANEPLPITKKMMKDFDKESMILGSVSSEVGQKRKFDEMMRGATSNLQPPNHDNISMTSSVMPAGEISEVEITVVN